MASKYYYTDIKSNPHFSISLLKNVIKQCIYYKKDFKHTMNFKESNLKVEGYFSSEKRTLTLTWEDLEDGEKLSQEIKIVEEESHLIPGSHVYYFRSPGTSSLKCRKLYLIGSSWRDRRTFRHHYNKQNWSHHDRDLMAREEPYRPRGKRTYRGKLTPYGKRCQKYEEREESRWRNVTKWMKRKGWI